MDCVTNVTYGLCHVGTQRGALLANFADVASDERVEANTGRTGESF